MENSVESIKNQIIILSLMRDEIRQVSPNLVFRSLQHRDDLYFAIIESLEELEDELEELEEKQLASEESENT